MIDETVEEIAELQTHSSSIVAIKAARALEELTGRNFATVDEFLRSLERNSNALRRAEPSHASLYGTQREIVSRVQAADDVAVSEAKQSLIEVIEAVVERVERGKTEAARRAAGGIGDGSVLLTHDYSSTVLEAIELALAAGRSLEVYVTEARPRYLGRKMARTLARHEGVSTTLLTDGAAGLALESCDQVLLGMDCIVGERFYNRVGTFPLVSTAVQQDVPVHVVGASSKVIESGGFAFENEFRSTSEVMREPADGFEMINPAYDVTPTSLLSAIITDEEP